MTANILGELFTLTSFGESHGDCIGIVVDGCPAGLAIDVDDIQREANKRKPSNSAASTARQEKDCIEVFSGIHNGYTTGAPVCLVIWNKDIDSSEYEKNQGLPRPGHADFPARVKYGAYNDPRGGGRFSGRITGGFVMAGALASKLLKTIGVEVLAYTTEIGGITAQPQNIKKIRLNTEQNEVRCADSEAAIKMVEAIEEARHKGDSLGGIVECLAINVPVGLGEPTFDTMEGDLAKAFFAIPAVKGVEFGAGFEAARMKGSQNNDEYKMKKGKITALTNNAGGILGGISNGMPITARIAVKPTPSISVPQKTTNMDKMEDAELVVKGRHDACIVPRAVSVAKSMMAIVLCDFALRAGLIPRVIK